jgi:hypothetical protein
MTSLHGMDKLFLVPGPEPGEVMIFDPVVAGCGAVVDGRGACVCMPL